MYKGAISSVLVNTSMDSFVEFDIDDNDYNEKNDRKVTKTDMLDGSIALTDFGYSEGRKEITVQIIVDVNKYQTLLDFKEDNSNEYLFHYLNHTYRIILYSVDKTGWSGSKARVKMLLYVVDRI